MEQYMKQKNQYKKRNSQNNQMPTLKIKNITFSRQYTQQLSQDILHVSLKLGKDINTKCLQFKNKNKQNFQFIYNQSFFSYKPSITDIFSIKSLNLRDNSQKINNNNNSQIFADISNLKKRQSANERKSTRNIFFKPSTTKQNRRYSKLKTSSANEQFSRKSSYDIFSIKSKIINEQKHYQKEKRLTLISNDKVFQRKIQGYISFLQQVAQLHGLRLKKIDQYTENPTFIIGKGNNAKLVKETLKRRWWLKLQQRKMPQFSNNIEQVNFVWTQTKIPEIYQLIDQKRIHNHFYQNGNLGNKKQLFYNMKSYYQQLGKNPFDYLPLTFHVQNLTDKYFNQFKAYYEQEKNNNLNNSKCLWILKPGQNSNRGRGITIHKEIQDIQKIINQQIETSAKLGQKAHTFIIQKYIQKPFLYQKRKFDLRCYFLLVNINQTIKGYWYRQGYIRTSCFQFNLNANNDQSNFYVHLTNDAVQKNCQNYGKYQEGNKIDYNTFKKYIALKYPHKKLDFDTMIYQNMKIMALDAMKATYNKIRGNKSTKIKNFQIFGLDFMIDDTFKPWLIEINTNPCLQTSCLVLQRIIPKMLDDALQLSLDVMYPPPIYWNQSKKHFIPNHTHSGFELIFDQTEQINLQKCQ